MLFKQAEEGTKATDQVTPEITPEVTPEVQQVLLMLQGEMTWQELMQQLGLKDEKHFRQSYQQAAIALGVIEMTLPDKPTNRLEKYRLTTTGQRLQAALQVGQKCAPLRKGRSSMTTPRTRSDRRSGYAPCRIDLCNKSAPNVGGTSVSNYQSGSKWSARRFAQLHVRAAISELYFLESSQPSALSQQAPVMENEVHSPSCVHRHERHALFGFQLCVSSVHLCNLPDGRVLHFGVETATCPLGPIIHKRKQEEPHPGRFISGLLAGEIHP